MAKQRLNDREQRNNRSLGRKQVFLVTEGENAFVQMHFGQKYASLFQKTLSAYEKLPSVYIGKVLSVQQSELSLSVTYLGAPIEPIAANIPKIKELLFRIHNHNATQGVFTVPRYIHFFNELFNDPLILSLIEYVEGSSLICSLGYGIEDPVVSNFTEDLSGVHLVDLDHFASDISLYYQVGFMIADVDVIGNQKYKSIANLQEMLKLPSRGDEIAALTCGYISRLCIDVINDRLNLDSYRPKKSLAQVRGLAEHLLNEANDTETNHDKAR